MTIAPEVDVLEQLRDGPTPILVVRKIFDAEAQFRWALLAMLYAGDIRLAREDATEVRSWEWQEILLHPGEWKHHSLCLTEQGAKHL